MSPLNWMHHTLIQALLSRGPLEEMKFHEMFSGVTGKNPGLHKNIFDAFLLKINKELAYVKFELRGCRNQNDGKVYYGVINNVADEQSKLGTRYSVPQIAFYRSILDAIIQDTGARGSISSIDAINLRLDNQTSQPSNEGTSCVPAAFKSFTLAQKEKTLQELVRDRWLCSSSDGSIGVGVRSFLDLRGWFRNNDVPSCNLCNEAAIKAEVCDGEGCNVRIHSYCLKNASRKAVNKCPSCGTAWNISGVDENEEHDDVPQNEIEHPVCKTEPEEIPQSRRQETAGQRGLRRLRSCKVETAADSPVRRLTRRTKRE